MTGDRRSATSRSGKREAVVGAAGRLFHSQGFHATGIDRIVAEAGVTPRTLYHHFRSKDDLLLAVLQKREEDYFSAFDQVAAARLRRHGDPVRAAFEALAQWLRTEPAHGCLFLRALAEQGHGDARVREAVQTHKARVLCDLEQRLEALLARTDARLAGSLMLLMEGATALAPLLGAEVAARRALDGVEQMLGHEKENSYG